MRLTRHLAVRAAIALATLLGVSLLIFVAMRFVPGGFEDMILGPFGTPEAKAAIRARYGLDQPVVEQYLRWLAAAVTGDLGTSLITHSSVTDEILRRAPTTLQLALMSTGFALALGVPLGIAAALGRAGSVAGRLGRTLGAFGASVPDFVLGAILVFVFSRWSLGLTIGGYVPFAEDPGANLRATILPALVLGLFGLSLVLRTVRGAVLEVLTQPHITAAVARGETPGAIVRGHVLRNAAIPVLTVTATYFGYLLGGAVVVEQLFSIPGVGNYIITAVSNRDYAVVQAGVLLGATVFVLLNMAADVAYVLIDPRIAARGRG